MNRDVTEETVNREKILSFLSSHKDELEKQFKISRIGLFGSYAVNSATEESDIDIIVSMPSDFDLYYDLKEYLEREFNKTVDLGLEKSIRELVKSNILNEAIYV